MNNKRSFEPKGILGSLSVPIRLQLRGSDSTGACARSSCSSILWHTYFCEKFVPGLIQSALYDPCHTSVIGLTFYTGTGGTHILGTRLRSFCGVGEPPYLPACFEGHMYRCLPPLRIIATWKTTTYIFHLLQVARVNTCKNYTPCFSFECEFTTLLFSDSVATKTVPSSATGFKTWCVSYHRRVNVPTTATA